MDEQRVVEAGILEVGVEPAEPGGQAGGDGGESGRREGERRGLGASTQDVDELDPECALPGLVVNEPREVGNVQYILNNSFGMLGINSVVIVKKI